ncbi:rRNA (guanine-N1)-methyltransferase [Shewanella marinintestina]|uniref:pilus assembly protein n=1 Tax=Shewanella marinintestina TaxID=190305 RepID=UPI00200CC1BB|nr:PilC/PilY family type IV pilus protein [Shewanella marinintestina]MCL1144868.1 rRNA (guanine-N1)-methyltransferase [Shewanella marinintestina]
MLRIKKLLCATAACIAMLSSVSFADDTELYVFESTARSGSRPQVLIIFDNSGSMGTDEYTDTFYPRGDENLGGSTKLFYSKGAGVPDLSSPNYIKNKFNGCKRSKTYLKDYGFFTGFIREYSFVGENGTWSEFPDSLATTVTHTDCFEDFEDPSSINYKNAKDIPEGLPVDSLGSSASPEPYTLASSSSSTVDKEAALNKALLTNFGIGKSVTFYTEKYVTWYHSNKSKQDISRLEIAQRVMEDTVVTTPSVDFGLAVFNYNNGSSDDGGRIISGVKRLNTIEKKSLIKTIGNLNAETWTPLCETLYEAYRYFGGAAPHFALEAGSASPARDQSIEKNGKYISPFVGSQCTDRAYVVYITDGAPSRDSAADTAVSKLAGYDKDNKVNGSYLPALASIMNNKDVNTSVDGDQFVTTFTIGFSDGAASAEPILKKAAELGGGKYFAASNASALQTALSQVFSQILETNASFTSPSIASNNFDRTQTFDSAYYAMFLPNKGARWMGNIKKFKVTGSGDIVDKNGVLAIDDDGNLKSSACSYWTPNAVCAATSGGGDGNDVRTGGASLAIRGTDSRVLYGNFGSGGALKSFTKANAQSAAGSEALLADFMGVDKTQLTSMFSWATGEDSDDDDNDSSTTDKRDDIFGDPLHSKPLAINFGSQGSPDIRVLVGTNHGFLHMLKDKGDDVEESWAFMPYELLSNVAELRANVPTGVHSVYGLDSSPVAYTEENASGGITKAWLFVGMRRGGKSYYALDITDPDSPSFMWKIDPDSTGMSELGQTWAEPVVTKVPGWPVGNTDLASAKPVIIFGAGYSPSTKDSAAVGLNDAQGRGVFVVDAETGTLVHAFGPSSGGNSTQLPGIVDSVPNAVAVLDSDGDGLTDRIYASDTGGNVWRMDLPSGSPSDSTNPWTAYKFADLGGNTLASDRRFFAEPVIAQTVFTNIAEVSVTVGGNTSTTTTYQNVPYDAVTLGTGHRPHPSDLGRADMFYVLQDRNVISRSFGGIGNPKPAPLLISDLYDVTTAAPDSKSENISFGGKLGWYYNFGAAGEKSLSASSIIEGRVFFTSYVPGDNSSANQCLISGMGRLYGFDLHKGTRSYQQEYLEIGERVPDTPQLVIPPNGSDDSYMYLIGIGKAGSDMLKVPDPDNTADTCEPGDEKCVGGGPSVNRIYYHINE